MTVCPLVSAGLGVEPNVTVAVLDDPEKATAIDVTATGGADVPSRAVVISAFVVENGVVERSAFVPHNPLPLVQVKRFRLYGVFG